jgi:uncharacterized protein DUF559
LDELNLNYEVRREQGIFGDSGECRIFKPDAYIELNKFQVMIEFDDPIHNIEDVKAKDKIRGYKLTRGGFIVLRFSLSDLVNKMSYVRSTILDALLKKERNQNYHWKTHLFLLLQKTIKHKDALMNTVQ